MNDRKDRRGDRTGDYPSVPHDRLLADGWKLQTKREGSVFRMPGMDVLGHTLLYVDSQLQDAIEAAGAGEVLTRASERGDRLIEADEDPWRFFFATALSFRPPLAPGIGPASIRPAVTTQARRSFVTDLEARGFEAVDCHGTQRLRTDAGDRGRLVKCTACLPHGAENPPERIDIEGWLAVWTTGGTFRIAGGAYPIDGMDTLLETLPPSERPSTDPGPFREELLELIRSVR